MAYPPGYQMLGAHLTPIWTPRGFLARGQDFWTTCCECGHEALAPFQALIDAGDGDKVLAEGFKRLRCSACGSRAYRSRIGEPLPLPERYWRFIALYTGELER